MTWTAATDNRGVEEDIRLQDVDIGEHHIHGAVINHAGPVFFYVLGITIFRRARGGGLERVALDSWAMVILRRKPGKVLFHLGFSAYRRGGGPVGYREDKAVRI